MKTNDDKKKYISEGNTKITLHEMIDDAIVDHKLKRKEVADLIGVDRSTVSNWCNGNRSPDIKYLKPLCALLDLNIYEILDIEPKEFVLTPLEEKLIKTYRIITKKQQLSVLDMLNTFIEPEKDK